ncbi:uncharacterized protein LOC143857402 [Tasmannia lanceolata]|uniref:uncharacterized protein LOC143857402 n=1 Tax=Tasmannia lanceolata TaxID=3420 RepID=UPI004064923F
MEKTHKIIRKSIHTFLQNYHHFAATVAFLAFPVSASILLSQTVIPFSPLPQTVYSRFRSLFDAAGFPPSSQFFSLLNLKLSQTISSSIFTLPFTLSFLLLAKASIIQILHHKHKQSQSPLCFSSLINLYYPLLLTQVCNSFVILSANATAFSLLFLAFNSLDVLGISSQGFLLFLSTAGAIVYSVILANALIICNMAIIVAGMESSGGFLAILKACVLVRGRAATALLLALPINLGLAAVEALFQYRVVRAYKLFGDFNSSIAWEAPLIVYIYSLLVILDTVTGCIFFESCKSSTRLNREDGYYYRIELMEERGDGEAFTNSKTIQELP